MFTSHRRVFAAREPVPESTDHPSGQQIPQQNGPHPLEAPLAGSAKSGIILGTSWLHVELTGSEDIRVVKGVGIHSQDGNVGYQRSSSHRSFISCTARSATICPSCPGSVAVMAR